MKRLSFLPLLLLCCLPPLRAQYVPVHPSHEGIYRLLDELGAEKVIDLHSLMKPYSRREIALWLQEADSAREPLDPVRQAEVDFYLRDYGRDLPGNRPVRPAASWLWQKNNGDKRFDVFYYGDSLFRIAVNPILGGDLWVNGNGSFHHWWNGVEGWATAGRFGFWASLRDNHESVELTARDFMNRRIGASNIKVFDGVRDYWEFRGGITYQWSWGHAGVMMDPFAWGENNAGANILSGRTPAFPRIELGLEPARWFRFRFVHASLFSEEIDSTSSFWFTNGYGTSYRDFYRTKYLAANMFSFIPVRGLELSVGNSVIYDTRGPRLAFMIPLAFFKAIDHSLNARNDNMNSQLFLSVSSRNLRGIHLHGTMFIDEMATGRIFREDEYNFLSFKAGGSALLHPRLRLAAEYTWTNALAFMHYIPTTTFESNRYNLGHYLEDNAREFHAALSWHPWRTLRITARVNHADKGPDHTERGTEPRAGIAPFEPIVWESLRTGLSASVQLVNDLYVRLGWEWRRVTGEPEPLERWTPEVYHGVTRTLQMGLNYGF